MKISMKEFEEARKIDADKNRPTDQRILDFLRQNKNFAVEFSDIFEGLEPELAKRKVLAGLDQLIAFVSIRHYYEVLDRLENSRKIQKANHGDKTYYAVV